MEKNTTLIVTTILPPTEPMKRLAEGCRERGWAFVVVGDTKSPSVFELPGARFLSIEDQAQTGFRYAEQAPVRHYARKNIGYLLAIREGASRVMETDDDNYPGPGFWHRRPPLVRAHVFFGGGWINVYRYFSDICIWPRGFPLDAIHTPPPALSSAPVQETVCPVQQGLVNRNPDVDAIYRLTKALPQDFCPGEPIALAGGAWCPFNSQNTAWYPEAFALLYLPAFCSFRMTDIWRSLVTQAILSANGWGLLFTEASAYQERNEHHLMSDFEAEVPGYLHNRAMMAKLSELPLQPGPKHLGENLRHCYECLIEMDLLPKKELLLVDAWLQDMRDLSQPSPVAGSNPDAGAL
jgi:hypothetical protein